MATWTLGGAAAVRAVNALASVQLGGIGRATDRSGELRLRSLRLVGGTVVAFGLILSLTAALVGEGTIFGWVFSTCWFAAVPVALVVMRWWRQAIFERVDASRKKQAFERWVIAHRTGWTSFAAASSAGVYLFVRGGVRVGRAWLGRFDLTRRALAYLFRRGMDRRAEQKGRPELAPLPDAVFRALGPEAGSVEHVVGRGAEQVDGVLARIDKLGGGVFAVVGERGAGKTTVLRRAREVHSSRQASSISTSSKSGRAPLARSKKRQITSSTAKIQTQEISALITARSREVGIAPSFEDLSDEVPPDADEIDRAEALDRAAAGYHRLLWDYSGGNPGVALHMWRSALGVDGAGAVRVKVFEAPDPSELEQLPDQAVFVLRAVLQLEPALPADLTRATMLRSDQVEDTLRYGLTRGYFDRVQGRYLITWAWFRAITRFLQRRHLLAAPR